MGDGTISDEPLVHEPFDEILTTLDTDGVSVVVSAGNSGVDVLSAVNASSGVRFLLTATTRDLLEAGRDIGAGYGMVDAPAALDAAARHAAGADVGALFPGHEFASSL